MRKLLLPAIGLLCSAQANATMVVPLSTLPADILNCFQTGYCYDEMSYGGNIESTSDTTGAAAFEYWQNTGGTFEHKWLMRYDLLTPPGTVAGTAWVSAQNSYNIASSDAHSFTLYIDSSNNPYLYSSPITLTLNDTDLADGSAYRSQVNDYILNEQGVFEFVFTVSGDLNLSTARPPCLGTYCGYLAHFNLLNMNFTNGMFGFNPQDTRGLLFSESDWSDPGTEWGMSDYQSIYVHAVPLPASALLFISGLAGGMLSLRRKKPAARAQ